MSDRATLKLSKQDVTRKALERIDVVAFSFSLFEVKKVYSRPPRWQGYVTLADALNGILYS